MVPTTQKTAISRAAAGRYCGAIDKPPIGGTKYRQPKAPRSVENRPGPKPPRIALTTTAKVNNSSGACSCRTGSSNSLAANATATQPAANAYRLAAEAGD